MEPEPEPEPFAVRRVRELMCTDGDGLLVTTLPAGALDGVTAREGENRALRDFSRTKLLYQMLSMSLLRGDLAVQLYTNESDEFAWCFDPDLTHVALGAVNNLGTGHHTDRSDGQADSYLCSVLTADEPDEGNEYEDENDGGEQAHARQREAIYTFLERQTDFAPNLLLAQALPFEVFVSPPAACPWPCGEWPPPQCWWLQRRYAHRGATPAVATRPDTRDRPHRTIFTRSQQQYDSQSDSSALRRYPNMVEVGSSADVIRAVLQRQRTWHEAITQFDRTGQLPPSPLKSIQADAEVGESLEAFLTTGQHQGHNELLGNPKCLRALCGILLLSGASDSASSDDGNGPAEQDYSTPLATAREWARGLLAVVEEADSLGVEPPPQSPDGLPVDTNHTIWIGRYVQHEGVGTSPSRVEVLEVVERGGAGTPSDSMSHSTRRRNTCVVTGTSCVTPSSSRWDTSSRSDGLQLKMSLLQRS